jgi:ankyrin repeat protein
MSFLYCSFPFQRDSRTESKFKDELTERLQSCNLIYDRDKLQNQDSPEKYASLICYAACIGELEVVSHIIAKNKDNAHDLNVKSLNALHIAIYFRRIDCVETILDHENQEKWLEKTASGENTPLHLAALQKRPKIARLLISHGASLTALNERGEMALSLVSTHVPDAMDAIEPMLDTFISLKEENNVEYVELDVKAFQKDTATNGTLHSASYGLSLLSCFITCGQTRFLSHPLCQALLQQNWKALKRLFYARLALSLCLLLSMTVYILVFHVFDCVKVSSPNPDR